MLIYLDWLLHLHSSFNRFPHIHPSYVYSSLLYKHDPLEYLLSLVSTICNHPRFTYAFWAFACMGTLILERFALFTRVIHSVSLETSNYIIYSNDFPRSCELSWISRVVFDLDFQKQPMDKQWFSWPYFQFHNLHVKTYIPMLKKIFNL